MRLSHTAMRCSSLILLSPTLVPLGFVAFLSCTLTVKMPGNSYDGAPPTFQQHRLDSAARLRQTVSYLAEEIGERNTQHPEALTQAAGFIQRELQQSSLTVSRHGYRVDGVECDNVEATVAGSERPDELVVLGAHYDSAPGTPGANDNGSGVAILLELARQLANFEPKRSLHLVAFVNEEPPYFRTANMGSRVYAKELKGRSENVVAMLSLETIGYFTDDAHTQHYPFPFNAFYPSTGNFVAFVGNSDSAALVEDVVGHFRAHAEIPSEGVAAPEYYQGVDWSDQQGFWLMGYPGLMVTDTAPNRYWHYHEPEDTPEKLNYQAMTLVTEGMLEVTQYLLNRP